MNDKMTPAQKAGLVIGKHYVVESNEYNHHCLDIGAVVVFTKDDGTEQPRFDCVDTHNYDFVRIDAVGHTAEEPKQPTQQPYTITVSCSCTSIEVEGKGSLNAYKRLSIDEIAAVLKILG